MSVRSTGRVRRAVTAILAAGVVTSLIVATPQAATAAPKDFDRPVKTDKPVPTKPLRVKPRPAPKDEGRPWHPSKDHTRWPAGGSADVDVSAGDSTRAGELPIAVMKAGSARATSPSKVRVSLLNRTKSEAIGVSGPVFTVSPIDSEPSGPIDVEVDYTAFGASFGGDWAARLRLVQLPDCAVSQPRKRECLQTTPVEAENAVSDKTVSATLSASSTSVYALTADGDSDSGDYQATDLAPSGSWTAGGNSGGFDYEYPLRLLPAAGPGREVALSYSSQSIDGRTVGKNNQASWVGDGWAYSPGFIERSYQPCWDDRETIDGKTPNNASKKTSDQCWRTENATISLNGTNTTLVKDDTTGKWRTQNDANWRVQHVKDSSLNAYDNDGEYWKITTPDGTQYYFGRSPSTARSTWTAPVFGNHPGEPCHATAFKDSSCSQAWRWMLDRAVDPSGNTTKFYYTREVGHYGAAGDANNRVSYIRGGSPLRIEYGLHDDEPTVEAAGKVEFTLADRCFTSPCYENGEPNAANWPDVPWDRECDQSPCTDTLAPAFFTQKRLSKITTFVRSGTSTFTDVESWELDHVFKRTDVLGAPVLWLQSITHRGLDGTTITDPPVVFSAVGMDNRVDALDNIDAMHRFRIQNIRTESGADIHVTYSAPECKRDTNMPTSPSSNGKRCYPVYWTPAGFEDPTLDWFHKYVVTEIAEVDGTGGSPVVFTKYSYDITGGGTSQLWAYDDNELIKKKHRTYGQWRGFPRVTTRVGDGDPGKGPEPTTTQRFYRGMHGQPLPDGTKRDVSVPDSEGNTASDHEALVGQLRENIQYLGSSIAEASTNTFWTKQTGKHTYSGGSRESYLSGVSVARTRKLLDDGVWRRTETRTTYTDEGYPAAVSDLGSMSTASDDLCTRTTYVDNDTAWIRGLPSRVETVSASCTATASRPDDIVTDTKTYYDGSATFGATPSRGLPTRTDEIDTWEAGAPKYRTTARTKYDALGRALELTDAKSRVSTTAYTPAGAGPVTKTVTTNPAGHQTATDLDPAYGVPTGVVDPNSKRTDLTYDALGRLGKVWLPGRAKATQTPHLEYSYLIRNNGPLAVTEKRIAPNSNYLTTINLSDSRYRARQTQTDATGGGRLINTTRYNERGQMASVTGPNYTTGAPTTTISTVDVEDDRRRTTYRYDALGRVVTEQLWSRTEEQWRTERRYGGNPNGWQEAVTPPDGGTATATITDARGQVSELRQFPGATPSGGYDATKYGYTPRGDLKTITLPDGRVIRYSYDLRGRQVKAEDPDKGMSETEYDATGQVIRTVDARGIAVSMTYDDLDRPLARYKGDPATGTKLAEWLYDTRAKGQVSKATTWIDGHAFVDEVLSYSHRYQPQQQTTTIPSALGLQDVAGTYLSTTTYRTDGSVNSRSMPPMGGLERESVGNTYDDWGNVVRMIGGASPSGTTTVYLDSAEYTPFGELQQRTLGRDTSPQALQTYTYEEATGRLSRLLVDREGTAVPNVANVSFSYDDAGNVLSLADEPENRPAEADVQCFDHDHLRRMTEAWSQAQKPCASTPEQSVVGGAAAYWTSYRFNTAGSRTSMVEHAPTGDVTTSYDYATPGKPNAVSAVSDSTGQQETFTWDATGNLKTHTSNGNTDTFTWNEAGKPVSIDTGAGTAKMFYTASGERIARIDADGGVTAFVAGQELTRAAGSSAAKGTRYYTHDGAVFATRTAGKDLVWLASDHHGTATWSINSRTLTSSVKRRDPYGGPRVHIDPDYWPGGQRGFVGGTQDPTGYVQLGARSYDPRLGMFLSVDPLGVPLDPQRMHPYAYANNAPITSTDPTGLTHCHGWECSYVGNGSHTDPNGPGGSGGSGGKSRSSSSGSNGGGSDWNTPVAQQYMAQSSKTPALRELSEFKMRLALIAKEPPPKRPLYSCEDVVVGVLCDLGNALNPFSDVGDCLKGSVEGCLWMAAAIIPGGKVLRTVDKLDSLNDARKAANAGTKVLPTPQVGTTKLQNLVDNLYKGTTNPNRVGNGTTMDAIRHERATGVPVGNRFHTTKGRETLRGLNNWLRRNKDAPYNDRVVAQSLADELELVLRGAG